MLHETETPARALTVEEYIAFEEAAEARHEFRNGKLIAMPGTTDAHNDLCFLINQLLRAALRGAPDCRVYQESVKVEAIAGERYVYPDVFVTCDPADRENAYIKKSPTLICEVISKSSRAQDLVDKFLLYQNIASFRAYLLVDSTVQRVELRERRPDGTWESAVFAHLRERIEIVSLGISLPMRGIYKA